MQSILFLDQGNHVTVIDTHHADMVGSIQKNKKAAPDGVA